MELDCYPLAGKMFGLEDFPDASATPALDLAMWSAEVAPLGMGKPIDNHARASAGEVFGVVVLVLGFKRRIADLVKVTVNALGAISSTGCRLVEKQPLFRRGPEIALVAADERSAIGRKLHRVCIVQLRLCWNKTPAVANNSHAIGIEAPARPRLRLHPRGAAAHSGHRGPCRGAERSSVAGAPAARWLGPSEAWVTVAPVRPQGTGRPGMGDASPQG